jgi:SAM-dependent methyltransferase
MERCRQDTIFDSQNQVDTGGVVRPTPESVVGGNWDMGVSYQAIDPNCFTSMLQSLAIEHSDFTFVDFGSGKGRALLLASAFPFRKVIGVEYCEELNEVARQNVANYPASARRCSDIEIITADATTFGIPEGPLVLFFFNPFGERVMASVVENVMASYRESRRQIIVIYDTPYFVEQWKQTGIFKTLQQAPAILDTGTICHPELSHAAPARTLHWPVPQSA